jgi:hypothetical protein
MSEEDEAAARRMLTLCRILSALLIGQVLLGVVYFLVDTIDVPWGQRFTWPAAGLLFLPPAAFIVFFVATQYFTPWRWPEFVWSTVVVVLPGFVAFFPFIQASQKSGNVVDIAPSIILLFLYLRDALELFRIWSRFGAQYREWKHDS